MRPRNAVSADWQKLRSLFEAALDVPIAERSAWLDARCEPGSEIRHRLDRLLAADSDGDLAADIEGEVQRAAMTRLGDMAGESDRGGSSSVAGIHTDRLGAYRVLRELGRGGMGAVYLAEQQRPRRRVALKTMGFGIAGEAKRRRFEYEAEILGRLRHPGIAQIYEAGTVPDGETGREIPFFAMEYIEDARPLDRFVREAGMDVPATVRLFAEVCAAVHHGHQQGVRHRDLKPGNVLVDSQGQPKVIDFGIACLDRAEDALSGEDPRTRITQPGQLLGTLPYMSPEQLSFGTTATDTRSDVYALGVILYELLSGRLPIDPEGAPVHVFAQRVQTEPPPRLTQPGSQVAEDLDWIVLKALSKDREERYGSVSEFQADLERVLRDEPVTAGPPSRTYALRKFVRRHRRLVVATVITSAVVVSEAIVATVGWQKASAAKSAAASEVEVQRAVRGYVDRMIQAARVDKDGREVTVFDFLASSDREILPLTAVRPAVAASLSGTVAATYLSLGLPRAALEQLERHLPEMRSRLGADDPHVLYLLHAYGTALRNTDQNDKAETVLQQALAGRLRVHGPISDEVGETRQQLAELMMTLGRFDAAGDQLQPARRAFAALHGEDDVKTLLIDRQIASLCERRGQNGEAEARHRKVLETIHRVGLDDSALAMGAWEQLGRSLRNQGRTAEAVECFTRALEGARRLYGKESSAAAQILGNLAVVRQDGRDFAGAERALRDLLAVENPRAVQPINRLIFRGNLAAVLERQGKLAESARCFVEVFAAAKGLLPEGHWILGAYHKGYGVCLMKQQQFTQAEAEIQLGLRILSKTFAATDARVQKAQIALCELYEAWGKPEAAARVRAQLPPGGGPHK